MRTYDSATNAVRAALRSLTTDGRRVESVLEPSSIGSAFGTRQRPFVEIIGWGFALSNPRSRIAWFRSRRLNMSYALGNCLWTLFGSDDLETIAFYNDRARLFSADGSHLVGSIGARIFNYYGMNQFITGLNRLQKDPTSRRVIIPTFVPLDAHEPPLDTPCSIGFQMLSRGGLLHWITYMRSQSAAMVLPYDVFLFTMLQEAAAQALGLRLGTYYHYCGSLHYYADEEDVVRAILRESDDSMIDSMPPMDFSPFDCLEKLKQAELQLRASFDSGYSESSFADCGLSPYWLALLRLTAIMKQRKSGVLVNEMLLEALPKELYKIATYE